MVRVPYLFPDRVYVKLRYRCKMGKPLDLEHPKTFTEKLQWLKLYNHKPEYTQMVDKILVKDYISDIIGSQYVIPSLFVWDRPEDIDTNLLPNKFVIKTNHFGGGSVFICKDRASFDFKMMKEALRKQLKKGIYWTTREWPYKNVEAKILCEPYVCDKNGELNDYKFYCFNGKVKCVLVATDRFTNHYFNYFDLDFNPLDIESADGRQNKVLPQKPENFKEMIEIASELSKGIPHVRVDLYNVDGKIYFGELTFFDGSGYDDMNSEKWNRKFGEWITLPEKTL